MRTHGLFLDTRERTQTKSARTHLSRISSCSGRHHSVSVSQEAVLAVGELLFSVCVGVFLVASHLHFLMMLILFGF